MAVHHNFLIETSPMSFSIQVYVSLVMECSRQASFRAWKRYWFFKNLTALPEDLQVSTECPNPVSNCARIILISKHSWGSRNSNILLNLFGSTYLGIKSKTLLGAREPLLAVCTFYSCLMQATCFMRLMFEWIQGVERHRADGEPGWLRVTKVGLKNPSQVLISSLQWLLGSFHD